MERKNNFQGYRVVFTPSAEKDLKKIDLKIAKKIYQKFDELVLGKPNLDVIKMVLALGADTTIVNRRGQTAEQMTHDPQVLALFAADRRANRLRKRNLNKEELQSSCKKQKTDA